jgi:signal peptidase I
MMRRLVVGLSCTALLGGVLAFLTGSVALVETHGNSMAPRITAGDLVLVRASTGYGVGDVVAYTSADLDQVVLHRVVSIEDGRYTFRGDHNDFDDPEQPTRPQLIGTELVHIPAGGVWLDRLTSPTALGILAFGLLAGGTTVETRRRRRKKAGKTKMSQHVAPPRSARGATGWPPRLRTTVAIAAVTGVVGLMLGAVSWTRPTTTVDTVTDQAGRTMTFSYHADVLSSPAYDGTRVTAPEPIFRKLTDQVDLRYTYRGAPGTVSVAAELSTVSGWTATVPLQRPVTFDDPDHTGSVQLDLNRLEARAQAAAEAIGIPAAQVDIAVVPTITTGGGDTFAPELAFALTPLQLTLLGGKPALTVSDTTPTQRSGRAESTLGLAGYQLSVSALRTVSVALALLGLLMLCLLGLVSARTATSEAAVIKRRYATMLLQVEPMTSPPGRPVVDVTDFPALARLAERYGLLVMHWTRSNVETFIVHDDGITYRYRTGHTQASEADTDQPAGEMSGRPG